MSGSGSSAQFETYGMSKNVAGLNVTVSRQRRQAPDTTPEFSHGPETPWRSEEDRKIRYRVTAPESANPDSAPAAVVEVAKPRTHYFPQGEISRYSGTFSSDTRTDRVRMQEGDGPRGQGSLFDVHHFSPYVQYTATHPEMRAHIPTLLSTANVESQHRWGEPLKSDNNLSEHSSRMVRRLAEAGAVEPPENETRNDMSAEDYRRFEDYTRGHGPGEHSEVPAATVQMGKQFLRDALRGPRQAVKRGAATAGAKKAAKQERMF